MKFPKNLSLIGLVLIGSGIALGVDTPTRTNNTVIVGNGVAGTKTLTFDIGGSNPQIRSNGGVLQLSPDGTNFVSVPSASGDTLMGKATTDTMSNKSIAGAGLTFNGSTSGSTVLKASATANGTITMPSVASDTMCLLSTSQTLSSKTMSSMAISGTWTADGNLTQNKTSGNLLNLLEATSTSGTNMLLLRTGNSTTSSRSSLIELDSAESSGQTWDFGMNGTKDLSIINQTTGNTIVKVLSGTDNRLQYINPSSASATHGIDANIGASDSGSYVYSGVTGAGTVFQVIGDGKIKVLTTNWSTGGTAVGVSSNLLTTSPSSIRYKKDIARLSAEIDSSKVFELKPVVFTYKKDGKRSFGYIAEETYKTNPWLVNLEPDEHGEMRPESVAYDHIVVLLLEEVRKMRMEQKVEHQRLEQSERRIAELEAQTAVGQ